MSWVDDIRRTALDQVDGCEKVLSWADAKAPPLIRWVIDNHVLTMMLPQFEKDYIASHLIDLFHKLIDVCRQVLDKYREMVSMLGSPDNLRASAAVLKDDVSGKASALGRSVTADSLASLLDSNWVDGDASEIYEHAFETQAAPLAEVSSTADTLHDALRTVANGIEDYYVQLALAIAGGVAAIAGTVVAVLGVIEAAAASPTVVGSVPGLAAMCIGCALDVVGLITAAISIFAMLQTVQHTVNDTLESLPKNIDEWDSPAFLKS
jgi:hypothetical protein